jgi:hypothetical protein
MIILKKLFFLLIVLCFMNSYSTEAEHKAEQENPESLSDQFLNLKKAFDQKMSDTTKIALEIANQRIQAERIKDSAKLAELNNQSIKVFQQDIAAIKEFKIELLRLLNAREIRKDKKLYDTVNKLLTQYNKSLPRLEKRLERIKTLNPNKLRSQ